MARKNPVIGRRTRSNGAWQNVERVLVQQQPPLNRVY